MSISFPAHLSAGGMINTRNNRPAATAKASKKSRRLWGNRRTSAVIRICSPRRNAITAPSIASQRNRIEASSSDQVSGVPRARAMMPARRTPISAATSAAAGISTASPKPKSTAASQDLVGRRIGDQPNEPTDSSNNPQAAAPNFAFQSV